MLFVEKEGILYIIISNMNSREGEGGTLMSEYMIMTDSTVDLPKEYLTKELGVPYIPLTYLIDDSLMRI